MSPSNIFTSPKLNSHKMKSGLISKKSILADLTERNSKEQGVVEVETVALAQQAFNLQKKTAGII